jgi:putative DNA primase/helicase
MNTDLNSPAGDVSCASHDLARVTEHRDDARRAGEPDLKQASRFLTVLERHDAPGEFRTYQTFDDRKDKSAPKRPHLARVYNGEGKAAHLAAANAQGAGIYMAINATDGKGREAHNVTRVRAVFIDADKNGVAVLQKVKEAGLAPHIIVESSPGKYHVYWVVAPPCALEVFKPVQQALARKFGTDNVCDLPRVLRVPGFYHLKNPAAPFMVRIVELNEELEGYAIEDIVGELGLDLDALNEAPSEAPASPATAETSGLERAVKLADVTLETIADLRPVLEHLAKKGWATDEGRWTDVLLALRSLAQVGFEDEARELWMWFSALDPEAFNEEEAQARWESPSREPRDITYKSIFKWAADTGCPNPKSAVAQPYETRVDRTDVGNANLLAQLTAGNLHYVPERRMWILWDGARWVEDVHGAIAQREALRVAEFYHAKALELAKRAADESLDAGERKKIKAAAEGLSKWELTCRGKRTIDAMLAVASRFERMQVPLERLNKDPWLLGVQNGVVDLRMGALRPAAREDLVTKSTSVPFDPKATAQRWQGFVNEITGAPGFGDQYTPRPELARYVQKALGYATTGRVVEHKMLLFIGGGSNGKNVLLDIAKHVAGDYWVTIAPEALMSTRLDVDSERPTPTAASLAGARAAISSESRDGQHLDVALIKRHTGGGFLTARQMRENTFTFEMTHKLLLMTNHRPALDHLDDAIRGRLHLVPFDRKWNRPGVPERNPALPDGDKGLPDTLRAEAQGVLAWLVRGAVAYAREGLEPPAEVIAMTRQYFREQEPLAQWLDGFEKCEPRDGTKAADLFEAFVVWCDENEHKRWPNTQKGFSSELQRRGVASKKTLEGKFYGLRRVKQVEEVLLV